MKLSKNFYKLLLFIFTVVVVLSYLFFYRNFINQVFPKQNKNSQQDRQYFESPHWNFSIVIPKEYTIKEASSYIDLYKSDKKINISKNGTNFNNVKDYLDEFDRKRALIVNSLSEFKIDGYDGIVREEVFENLKIKQKVYYIYLNSSVYTFSTESTDLYTDLEQIVKSFEYLPPNSPQ